jgi:chromosome segregation and condensation protein ScpB
MAAGEGTGNLSEEDKAGNKDSGAKIPEKLTDTEYKVLIACKTPCTIKELNEITDIKSRSYLREKIIVPLIESGLLKKTIPDKSKSPDQKYVTTKEGLNYLMTDN